VGLGRMGAGLAGNALEHGHEVVGFSKEPEAADAVEGLEAADSLADLVGRLASPRVVLVYVPHGAATEEVCNALASLLESGDVVLDGGNSHWDDSRRRYEAFAAREISFLDCGTSGGVRGARDGACFMVGGDRPAFGLVEPILRDLAVDEEGVVFVGESGSGHFTKLVHNAIEFGMVQAIAEGVEMLQRSDFAVDLPALFNNWQHGSVIRSWLVGLMGKALADEPNFRDLSTYVEDTQEVKWVLNWALDRDIPTPVTSDAQQALMEFRNLEWPAAKAVALLRNQYGGHPVHRRADDPDRT
jgi:6-phosphogluconate dehydrogenase